MIYIIYNQNITFFLNLHLIPEVNIKHYQLVLVIIIDKHIT